MSACCKHSINASFFLVTYHSCNIIPEGLLGQLCIGLGLGMFGQSSFPELTASGEGSSLYQRHCMNYLFFLVRIHSDSNQPNKKVFKYGFVSELQ